MIGKARAIKRADVGFLHRDDLIAAAKRAMKLVAADIDGINAFGAAQNQHLGEAAGRGADVDADAIRDVELKMIERRRKLDPAAGNVSVCGSSLDDGGAGDFL